ncbi:MAG TPA: alpha-D-glucose phosphate-specific phosphoglucomutase, partial [Luteimonas sp.]
MASRISPLAGTPARPADLVDVGRLIDAYHDVRPDWEQPAQRVAFGTSGHRGSSLHGSFNEHHVLAISQAVCDYRAAHGIDGPLFIGIDT